MFKIISKKEYKELKQSKLISELEKMIDFCLKNDIDFTFRNGFFVGEKRTTFYCLYNNFNAATLEELKEKFEIIVLNEKKKKDLEEQIEKINKENKKL